MARSESDRLAEKTAERQFLHDLENNFELAPATPRALLSAAQQVLLSSACSGEVHEGQMLVTVVSSREPAGKPLSAMKKKLESPAPWVLGGITHRLPNSLGYSARLEQCSVQYLMSAFCR